MIVVVTPTYRKFDLCVQMIESANAGTVVPMAYIVLDNSAGKFTEYVTEHNITLGGNVAVLTAESNMGCAASWNMLLSTVKDSLPDALVVVTNDDILFLEDTLEKLSSAALTDYAQDGAYRLIYCAGGIDAPNAFSLFLVHPETFLSTVGPFDETIWPAYFEDGDMYRRIRLAGYDLTRVADCNADHGEGSATLKAFTLEETEQHHHRFRRNQEYFIRKWGGLDENAYYVTPFNGESVMQHMLELRQRYGF